MTDQTIPRGAGALAAALAKAQASFAPVKRDKTVNVKPKDGPGYSFKYAPLENIIEATRQPLADNGLVVVQTLDDGALVTTLLHETGGFVTGRLPIPDTRDIKQLGSAITYLRRYALQALLGIAAEDDDDGSLANGDSIQPVVGGETLELLGRVDVKGKAVAGGSDAYKGEWRQTPDDGLAIGFRLVRGDDKDIPQVLIVGDIATALSVAEPELLGKTVHVKGRLYNVKQKGRTGYNRLVIGEADGHFVETDDVRIPPADIPAGQEGFDLSEEALT